MPPRQPRIPLALALLGLALCRPLVAEEDPPPAAVEISVARDQQMAPEIFVPGTVVSRNDARIAAEVAGQLTWVAEVGDRVAAGEVVARIDDQALQLQLRNDEATIRRLEANLSYIAQQMERTRRLSEQGIAPASDLEEVLSRHESAAQELVVAQVARESTLFALSRSRVRAPFTGKVVERLQQPGGYVSVGQEIARLVDVDHLEVRAQAPLSVEPFIREGLRVRVRERDREVESPIRTVIRVGDERSRMFEVRIALEKEPWIIGSAVRVALPTAAARRVVAVPRDTLILRRESVYLFKLTAGGTAERVTVETGVGQGDLIEVQGDVEPGDLVVVRGGERLRPGQPVTVRGDAGSQVPAS